MQKQTTDDQEEVFDIVNLQDKIIGQATRGECHSNPDLIHRSVCVFIFNHKKQLFMQKRSLTKDLNPGVWAISVGGHVKSGDTYLNSAVREIYEEVGIKIKAKDLIPIHKDFYQGKTESELNLNYFLLHDGPFTLDIQEIDSGKWFKFDDLLKKITEKKLQITPSFEILMKNKEFMGKIRDLIEKIKS